MADREFIIDILLRARDDTARAFAEATGQLEAYNRLLDHQSAKEKELQRSQQGYREEFEKGTTAHQRRAKALEDLNLKSTVTARRIAELRKAQEDLSKAEREGISPEERVAGLDEVAKAHKRLQNAYVDEEGLNKSTARSRADRIRQLAEEDQHTQISARNLQKAGEDRKRALQALDKIEEDIHRRQIKRGDESKRELENMARQQESAAKAEEALNTKRLSILQKSVGPADVLSRPRSSQTDEIRATRQLAVARQELINTGYKAEDADRGLHNIRQMTLADYGFESEAARNAAVKNHDHARALEEVSQHEAQATRMTRDYRRAVDDVAAATVKRDEITRRLARAKGMTPEEKDVITIRAEFDIKEAEARLFAKLEEIKAYEKRHGIEIPVFFKEKDIKDAETLILARAKMAAAERGAGGRGGGGQQQETGLIGQLQNVQKWLAKNDESARNVQRTMRASLGTAAVFLIQPLITVVVGLVGSLVALASAAVAAGVALGALFSVAMAQGAPVMGLVVMAAVRLRTIFQYVAADYQKQQQQFIAHYQAAHLAKQGINQVAEAQRGLRDALRSVQQAQWAYQDALFQQSRGAQNLMLAQRNLTLARRDAARQLQDLIFQEKAAKLAAEGSATSLVDAQKALEYAMATGGDVRSAQLALRQAQLGHQQAQVGAVRAHQDAQTAVQQGISGNQQVIDAQRSVVDASRAIVQNQRAVAQAQYGIQQAQHQVVLARAQIMQAQEAARGYNLQAAAQQAWLRSQMTQTELALANNIKRIMTLFHGVHAQSKQLTDNILGAFIPITDRLYHVLKDPKVFGAAFQLSQSVGNALKRVALSMLSPEAVRGMTNIMHQASENMKPLADIAIAFFKGIGSAVQTAGPFVHDFLGWIDQAATKFSNWIDSTKGKNYLQQFFQAGFDALRAFLGLGGSVIRFISDVATLGGGAAQGMSILDRLKDKFDSMSSSIEHQGSVWKDLKKIWELINPVLNAIGQIIDAIVHGLIQIGSDKAAVRAVKDIADIIVHDVIPAFVQWIHWISVFVDAVVHFFQANPLLAHALGALFTAAAAFTTLLTGVKLLLGPLAAVAGLIISIWKTLKLIEGMKALDRLLSGGGGIGRVAGGVAPVAEGEVVAAGGTGLLARGAGMLGKVARGGAIAAVGYFGAQALGGAIGGRGGRAVSSIGGDAAIGAGIGSVLGPEGALAGAAAGALYGGVKFFLSSSGPNWSKMKADAAAFGQRIGASVTEGFSPEIRGRFQERISDALKRANQAWQYMQHPQINVDAVMRAGGFGNFAKNAKSQAQAWVAQYWLTWQSEMHKAGQASGQALGVLFQSVMHPTAYAMLAMFKTQFAELPNEAKKAAALAMLEQAQTLISQGKLPKSAMGQMIRSLEGQIPGFRHYMNTQGFGIAQDFTKHMQMRGARASLQSAMSGIAHEFGFQAKPMKRTFFTNMNDALAGATNAITTTLGSNKIMPLFDPLKNAGKQSIQFIKGLLPSLHGETRKDAQKFLDQLQTDSHKAFNALDSTSKSELNGFGITVTDGMGKAADKGAKAFDHLRGGVRNTMGSVARTVQDIAGPISDVLGSITGDLSGLLGATGGRRRQRRAMGGPIFGYGGGDRVPVSLEGGEHVWSKEEVSRAGGHAAMFALRSYFGGGRQSPGPGYQVGGAVPRLTVTSVNVPAATFPDMGLGMQSLALSVRKMNDFNAHFSRAMQKYLDEFRIATGDGGTFAAAAAAIEQIATELANRIGFLANGIKQVGNRFVNIRPGTAIQVAQQDLNATETVGRMLMNLHVQQERALSDLNKRIADFRPTNALQQRQYDELLADRKSLLATIDETDSKIVQNRTDAYEKAQTLFQAQLDASMRRPTLALSASQAQQRIGQAFGITSLIASADAAAVQALKQQYAAVQRAYQQAAARAAKDPRWQKTADDLKTQLDDLSASIAETTAQQLTDAISAVEAQIQRQLTRADLAERMAAVTGGYNSMAGAQAAIGASAQRAGAISSAIGQYQQLYKQASAVGDVAVMNDLKDKIAELTVELAEANLKTQQLITAERQLAANIIKMQVQATSGLFQAANSIAQTLGQITGSMNLPALIQYAKEAGQTLIQQGQDAIKNIRSTMGGSAFGDNQSAANTWLQKVVAAFQSGPQQFADWLAKNAGALGKFEASLPEDQAALFQDLVQSVIDNTQSTVDNTEKIKELNGQMNQQQFSSSAWTMFRQAIFTGLGGLLPQYAMAVPSMDTGGLIASSGLLYGHRGEGIMPANVLRDRSLGENRSTHVAVNVTNPTEVADPIYLGNEIAWRLNHDPNSR